MIQDPSLSHSNKHIIKSVVDILMGNILYVLSINYICLAYDYLILNYKKRIKGKERGSVPYQRPPLPYPTPCSSPCVCGEWGRGGSRVGAHEGSG